MSTESLPAPGISVVIATRDRAALVSGAVRSILGQSRQDVEVIVVDDASSDETPAVLAGLARSDPRVRPLRSQERLGPGGARNRGIEKARAPLVAILDDDDVALPERLEQESRRFVEDPGLDVVCSAVHWVDGDLKPFHVFPGIVASGSFPATSAELFRLLYLESNKVPNTTLLVRTVVFRETPYPETPWIGEDWLWCLELSASGRRFGAVAEPLVLMRRDRDHRSLMHDKAPAFRAQRQVLREIRAWLEGRRITVYEDLHRPAWSNQLVREARYWGGARGLLLTLRALAVDPSSGSARQTLAELGRRAASRAGRIMGRPGRAEQ